jgi:hypothetical protein
VFSVSHRQTGYVHGNDSLRCSDSAATRTSIRVTARIVLAAQERPCLNQFKKTARSADQAEAMREEETT